MKQDFKVSLGVFICLSTYSFLSGCWKTKNQIIFRKLNHQTYSFRQVLCDLFFLIDFVQMFLYFSYNYVC